MPIDQYLNLDVEDKPAGIHESIGRMYLGEDRLSGDFQKMYPGLMDVSRSDY